jgi:hypothetical protein
MMRRDNMKLSMIKGKFAPPDNQKKIKITINPVKGLKEAGEEGDHKAINRRGKPPNSRKVNLWKLLASLLRNDLVIIWHLLTLGFIAIHYVRGI